MILSRRKAHFYMWVGLAGLLPIVFLAGLIWRPAIPTVDEATDNLFAAANFPTTNADALASETIVVNGTNVQVEATETANSDLALTLIPTQPLQFSNILVYWTPGDAAPESVEADAILLGQLSGTSPRKFPVSSAMQTQSGHLLFYSRGQSSAIAAVPLPKSLFP
ncbi:MAG: hypothetical protein AAGA83_26060 [Cyanobacteria bacterium P01_F01_bin.116]